MNDEDDAYGEDDIEEECTENDNNDIEQIAKDLATNNLQISDWVVVLYYEQWYPGIVKNV